ncbi:TcaA NTF2-like domain-containing protein [Staphylococcus shinii]|uniref:TcaA NTF2-like domain-containing protein n=1 Tax=Staphylococcus shinii TaxID=2912228 RepID=UPI003F575802
MTTEEDLEEEHPPKKKKVIIWIVILFIIVLISLFIFLFINHESSEHELSEFKNDVLNKKYDKISEKLSGNGKEFSKNESKNLVKYIYKNKGKNEFLKEIKDVKKRIKNVKNYDIDKGYGAIKDNKGRSILTFKKDGKKLLFFESLRIEPNYVHIYLPKDKQESTYSYQYNGENHSVQANVKKETDLGEFIVGNYHLKSEKEFKSGAVKGKSKGNISVNTDDFNKDENIMSNTHYKTYSVKPLLVNSNKLEKDSLKVYINGEQKDYKDNKVYGKYPTSDTISVKAKGTFNDETFTTDTDNVDLMSEEEVQRLKLTFDESEIDKEIKKQKEVKKQVNTFMKEYTSDLTKGYKDVDYEHVSHYFVKDSSLGKHIKSMIKSKKKTKYKDPKVSDIKVNGSKITLKLSKKDDKKNEINSRYELKYVDGTFKIVDYYDI